MRLLFLLLLLSSCSMFSSKELTWAGKKRECHTHYMNGFGLVVDEAIKICKDELENVK